MAIGFIKKAIAENEEIAWWSMGKKTNVKEGRMARKGDRVVK